MQIKSLWDITSNLSEWLSSKRQETVNVGKRMGKRKPSDTVGGNVKWCGRQYREIPQKLRIALPGDPAIPPLDVDPKIWKY